MCDTFPAKVALLALLHSEATKKIHQMRELSEDSQVDLGPLAFCAMIFLIRWSSLACRGPGAA